MRIGWLRFHAWPVLPFLQHILPLRYTVVSSLLCFPPFLSASPQILCSLPSHAHNESAPLIPKPTSTPYISTTLLSSSTHHTTPPHPHTHRPISHLPPPNTHHQSSLKPSTRKPLPSTNLNSALPNLSNLARSDQFVKILSKSLQFYPLCSIYPIHRIRPIRPIYPTLSS